MIEEHLKRFSSVNEYNNDFTIPIIATIDGKAPVRYNRELTLVTSGTVTVSNKTSGSFTSGGQTYSYSYNMMIFGLSRIGNSNNCTMVLKIDGTTFVGTYSFTHSNPRIYETIFSSPGNLYVRYYLKEKSGQGIDTQTEIFYTNLNLTNNSTINYEIYT